MRFLLVLLLVSPPALFAGDFLGQPSGGSVKAGSESGAIASNRQSFNFGNSGNGPASTPASMFAPQSDCQAYIQQSVGVFVMNESTTMPVSLYHCIQEHFASIMGGLAVAQYNMGDIQGARDTVMIARDTLVAGNRDGHRTARSLGIPIASAPDEGDGVRFLPGGPLLSHVIATPGAPKKQPYVPKESYQPPPSPNPAIDQLYQEQMRK